MFFDKIIHGTQYYRTPTPLPEEWEGDIAKMEEFNMDAFQIRINWRWNERREGEYDFSDVDKLMDLAEKYNRKVIIKFLLECAPQYVFDKYGGTRIGPKGEQLRGGAHGAFYGGWRPCFTNPQVQAAAVRFVEKVAERYHNRKNLILWNAWNEIRNRPIEDCFCPHCRKAFGKYLQNKFGTIEKLNQFYGTAEDSFDTIALPAMAHGFWDIYEFKKFKGGTELYNYVKFVYDGIRKYDSEHPVMTHAGFTSAFQNNIGDVCDDFTVSKAVDFWGTSIPCACSMDTHEKRLDFFMLNDFLRSVDENYFVHEIYPGLGMFKYEYDTPFDMRFKLYSVLSNGAKGLVYWQYRAERVGHEQDCAGMVRADGSPRPVAYEAQKFGADLTVNMQYFVGAKVQKAEVGIVFDFDSMLMSEIEDAASPPDYSFDASDPVLYYRNAHAGMYRMLTNGNYPVDYVSVTKPELFEQYKVLYFPYYTMLDHAIIPYLQKFLEKGGTLIADEGFGFRTQNTWMQPYDIDCKPLMTARMRERRRRKDFITFGGAQLQTAPYRNEYKVEDAEECLHFGDGSAAAWSVKYGKGKIYLLGFSVGYSYYETGDKSWLEMIDGLLKDAGVEKKAYADAANGIYEKRLLNGDKEIIFIFNAGEEEKQISIGADAVFAGGVGTLENGVLTVPARECAYVVHTK